MVVAVVVVVVIVVVVVVVVKMTIQYISQKKKTKTLMSTQHCLWFLLLSIPIALVVTAAVLGFMDNQLPIPYSLLIRISVVLVAFIQIRT